MIFDIQYKEQKVLDGYSVAQEILMSSDLVERIYDVVKFTYTQHSPALVAINLRNHQTLFKEERMTKIPVKEYFYKSRKVNATTKTGDNSIYVNSYNVPHRTIETYIQNAAHEFAHVPMGFSHGTNHSPGSWLGYIRGDREDKNMSVPHTLGRLVKEIAKEKSLIKG